MSMHPRNHPGSVSTGTIFSPQTEVAPSDNSALPSQVPNNGQVTDHVTGRPRQVAQTLAQIRAQAQFLLYLADQIEESLEQIGSGDDAAHQAFLNRVLAMYASQLEHRHQGLGDRVSDVCDHVFRTVGQFDPA
jgi:hypothetical protein